MQLILENFTKRFGDTTVIDSMNLTVEHGEMLALLGPSGCGKSTTLFAVCGIHRIDGGRLMFGADDVTYLPSQKRPVGVVFQNYALYPHMSVAENIAFPLKVQKVGRDEIDTRVREMAEMVHITELLERKPAQLSGGQQQRVALARAIVRKPDVLLLDEPLANLDAKLRLEMRSEIRRIQKETGITAILVTHDQVEAMSMCDRIALMKGGEIVQIDTPSEIYNRPANQFVAGFVGNPPISFLPAKAAQVLTISGGDTLPRPAGMDYTGTVTLGIRPEDFGPGITGDATLAGQIKFIESQGREDLIDVVLSGGDHLLRAIMPAGQGFNVGDHVNWPVDLTKMHVFAADGARQ